MIDSLELFLWLFSVNKVDYDVHKHLVIQYLSHVFDDVMIYEIFSSLLFWIECNCQTLLLLQIRMVFHFLVVQLQETSLNLIVCILVFLH